jgi:hypothetical protein
MGKVLLVIAVFIITTQVNLYAQDNWKNWRCGNNLINLGDSKGDVLAQVVNPPQKARATL